MASFGSGVSGNKEWARAKRRMREKFFGWSQPEFERWVDNMIDSFQSSVDYPNKEEDLDALKSGNRMKIYRQILMPAAEEVFSDEEMEELLDPATWI